tara:strand:- start:515 stop:1012 length:498 start_codon:yes stop_codon:yes gene_type:complete
VQGGRSAGADLGEEVEVAQREVERDRLLHLDGHLLLLLGVHRRVLPQGHVAGAHLAGDRELDAVLGDGDGDGVAQDGQVAADALELASRPVTKRVGRSVGGLAMSWCPAAGDGRGGGCVHLDLALVLGIGDAEVLRVNVHELELEVRDAVLRLVLCGARKAGEGS